MDSRLSENMFNNNNNGEAAEQAPNSKKKLTVIISILVLVGLIVVTLLVIILITYKSDSGDDYNPIPENEDLDFTEEEHRQLSRKVATQTMVLATNNDVLPLKATDQVVLFGKGTNETIYGGWGSGEVYEKGTTTNISPVQILKGIENQKDKFIYIENDIGYEIGIGIHETRNLTEQDIEEFAQKQEKAERTVAILTISRRSGEGSDRPQDQTSSGTLLTDREIKTYNAIIKYFDKVVVILNVGSVMELNDIEKDEKTSILISFLPGMEAGNAIADDLVGDANPSGHLTDTWAKTIDDYPTTVTFTESEKYVKYKEGLFVGYRYFEEDEEKQSQVVFPFGHGLSYTTFSLDNKCNIDQGSGVITITSEVKNTGSRPGRQVVQVYVQKPENDKFVKVKRELVGFAKTEEIKDGESETLTITFKLDDLASYDDTGVTGNRACYVLEKGDYIIYVADSVAGTRKKESIVCTHTQNELKVTQKLKNRLIPHDPDVADANTKPIFEELFKKNPHNDEYYNELIYNLDDNIQKNEKVNNININEINQQNVYTNIPTNKFNDINFKSVLMKEHTWEELADSMTNEELAFLSYGKERAIRDGTGIIGGFYNSGPTAKYNIPSGDTLDGPAGLRQSEVNMGSTAWPCSTALASSFDVKLLYQVGEETGKEARRIGCSFWLAPGMNIHRSPLCGRNFEYYSEDPLVTGKMASAIAQGLQSKRVSITLKHFAFNNKEKNRNGELDNGLSCDSRMAERVAREIYLKGFEIAVKEGHPWSIMTSYNRMNSMKTSESYDLLTGILREEWKYDGLVMTDWGTTSKIDREAHAGNGVKMPSNGDGINGIINGLANGVVTRDELKRNIIYVFKTLSRTFCIDALFKPPNKTITITEETLKIKVYNYTYRKYSGISYEKCEDEDEGEDKGYNPTHTKTNSWITIYINNPKDQERLVRIRYSSVVEGFGVAFKKYGESLGEITNLEVTGDWQKWNTSPYTTVKFPKGSYELTLLFIGYSYKEGEDENKGNINWVEILEKKS